MILSKELSEMLSSGEESSKEPAAEVTGNFSSLLSDDMKVFLGIKEEREPATQLAANGSVQQQVGRMPIDTKSKNNIGTYVDSLVNAPASSDNTPKDSKDIPVKYRDEEEVKRYLEKRKKEGSDRRQVITTPKLTDEELQGIKDEKERVRREESLKHIQD